MSRIPDLNTLLDWVAHQSAASSQLTRCTTLREMLGVIAQHMLAESGHFVAVTLVDHDPRTNIIRLRTLASANRHESFQDTKTVDIPSEEQGFPAKLDLDADLEPFFGQVTANNDLSPSFATWLETHRVKDFAVFALRQDGKTFGLFSVNSTSTLLDFSQTELQLFQILADHLAGLMHSNLPTLSSPDAGTLKQAGNALTFVQKQFEATSTVYGATEPREIPQALYDFIGHGYLHAHLALVNPDPQSSTARIVAEIEDGKTAVVDRQVKLADYPVHEALAALETLYVPDVNAEQFLNATEVENLKQQKIGSMVISPMVANQHLIGLIVFTNPTPIVLEQNQLRALRNLTDQAAIGFENRQLLASTAHTLEETRLLYEVNRSILASQDTLDILRSLREHLVPDAHNISHIALSYDSDGRIQRVTTRFLSTPSGEQVLDYHLEGVLGPVTLNALKEYWVQHSAPVIMIEDLNAPEVDYPLADLSRKEGTHSLIVLPGREGDRVHNCISISYDTAHRFEPGLHRLFEAVSDQIAIVTQNHQLLYDAQISAAQLGKQVEALQTINQISNVIIAAPDETNLLDNSTEAIVRLLGVDHSGIVLVEPGAEFGHVVSEYPVQGAVGAQIATQNNPLWDEMRNQGFKPLLIEDVDTDSRIEPLTHEILTNLGVHSMALVPIVVQEIIVGGIGLDIYSKNRSVTPEMLEIAQVLASQINLGLQNIRLVSNIQSNAEQLSRQVSTLQTLNQLAAQINAILDERELLDRTLRMLPEMLNADHCSVALIDADEITATVTSEYPSLGAVGAKFTLKGNIIERFVSSHDLTSVVINDLEQSDPWLSDSDRNTLRALNIKALMILPLLVSGKVIGSLGIDLYSMEHSFTQGIVEIAQTIASQIAIGLQNIRLFKDAQRRADQLQRIAAFSQSVQSSLDMASILNIALTESARMLPMDQMNIMIFDPVHQALRNVAQIVDNRPSIQLSGGDIIPITGQIAQVWSNWHPIHIGDLRALTSDMDPSVTVRSWLMLPILARGRILGIVSVGYIRPNAYSETDVALFTQLVNQMAAAIENAEAFQQSQKLAKNEALVNEISTQLQRQMDISSMLNITVNELGKALGARRGRIRLAVESSDQKNEAE